MFFLLFLFMQFFCMQMVQAIHERPLVIVIPSYNNAQWYQKNLDSIFMQEYSNYRVIYIDDYSSDNTANLVDTYVTQCEQQHLVTLIKNNTHKGAMANHYHAIHQCENHEIIIQLDGDDWLKHKQVLARINKEYENPNTWLTYGQFETYPPDGKPGNSKPMPRFVVRDNGYREYAWITSAPRTFYAGLFKEIKLESLLYQSKFVPTTCDLACMFPMLEMAAGRIKFIPDILYVYNNKTLNNDFKKHLHMQLHMEYYLRAQKKYQPLNKKPYKKTPIINNPGIVLLSSTNAQMCKIILELLIAYTHNYSSITIAYWAYSQSEQIYYQELQNLYSQYTFTNLSNPSTCKQQLLDIFKSCKTEYTLLTTDICQCTKNIDLLSCAQIVQQTKAYGFYLGLDSNKTYNPQLTRPQKIPPYQEVTPGVYAWQLYTGEFDWRTYNTDCAALYPTQTLIKQLQDLNFNSYDAFIAAWQSYPIDFSNVGLFIEHSITL